MMTDYAVYVWLAIIGAAIWWWWRGLEPAVRELCKFGAKIALYWIIGAIIGLFISHL